MIFLAVIYLRTANNPVNFSDEDGHWKLSNWAKIAIGVAAIAVGVAATVATGGAAAPALIAALQVAGGSAAIGALFGGITGGWRGALNGACDGFMWGGIFTGAGAVATAARVAKIGTSFGKLGTLVKYQKININWRKTTAHMLKRMSERGMSKSTIEWVVKNGKGSNKGRINIYILQKKGRLLSTGQVH